MHDAANVCVCVCVCARVRVYAGIVDVGIRVLVFLSVHMCM